MFFKIYQCPFQKKSRLVGWQITDNTYKKYYFSAYSKEIYRTKNDTEPSLLWDCEVSLLEQFPQFVISYRYNRSHRWYNTVSTNIKAKIQVLMVVQF